MDKRRKLTAEQVAEIRRVYQPGSPGKKSEGSLCSLARRYGVGISTIKAVVNGTTWKQ